MNKIFLATIEHGNYLLTAWDTTAKGAEKALEQEYNDNKELNLGHDWRCWHDYRDHYEMRLLELDRGVTEWT